MNALFELLGTSIRESEYTVLCKNGSTFDDYIINKNDKRHKIELIPKFNTTTTNNWFNNVKFAKIEYFDKICILKSNRTKKDEEVFYNTLKDINYDSGYGIQELYGIIVFNNHSWLSRGEYDGSEWWENHIEPKEEDYL